LAQTATRRWEALLHRFLLVGVFMRGITTYSRGGFIAAGVIGIVALLRSTHKIRAIVSIGIIALLVNTVMPRQFLGRMNTINPLAEERDDSARGRLHFWQVAVTMAEARPLNGVGFNTYNEAYDAYNKDPEFGGARSPHSVWFGLLGELGYPGLLLFVAIW